VANLIDTHFQGREHAIGCYEIDGVLVDPGPTSSIQAVLDALGDREPRAILLTHIHLDHAGATGTLVQRFPDLRVYVHEIGARHMVDPSKLLPSAARLYGDRMERLWGEFVPVPERNVTALTGGEEVEGFEVLYTPGHASHHVSYLHLETRDAYVGDMAGVRIPPSGYTLAPTVPPEFDPEQWLDSVERIRGWDPATINMTHYGRVEDVDAQFAALSAWLDRFAYQERGEEEWYGRLRREIAEHNDAEGAKTYEEAAPPYTLYPGLERYWSKR
jgi:glyoxylase-like metal-dependent hydrolase (beta-lactamase superfamily II)